MAKSNLKEEYKLALKGLRRRVSALQRKGFEVDINISLNQTPKRVTRSSIQKVKSLTTAELRKSAYRIDPESGTVITAEESLHAIRSRASKKAAATVKQRKAQTAVNVSNVPNQYVMTLSNFEKMLTGQDNNEFVQSLQDIINNQRDYPTTWSQAFKNIKDNDRLRLEHILAGALASEGVEAVGRNIEANALQIMSLAERIMYGNSGRNKDQDIDADLTAISSLLRGRALTQAEAKEEQEYSDSLVSENPLS